MKPLTQGRALGSLTTVRPYQLLNVSTHKYPLSYRGDFVLKLEPLPEIDWMTPHPVMNRIAVRQLSGRPRINQMGNILDVIFGFIFRIIKAIIKKIIAIIEALIYFITHPLELLKAIIIAVVAVILAPLVLGFIGLGSVSTALFSGVDTIASNFIEQLVSVFTDPIGFLEDSVSSLLSGEIPTSWEELGSDPVSEMAEQGAENVLGAAGGAVGEALSGIGQIFPDLGIPSLDLPEIPMPDLAIPDPGLSLPELSLPDTGIHISLSDVTLPDTGLQLSDFMTGGATKKPVAKKAAPKKIAKVTPQVKVALAPTPASGGGWLALALAAGSAMVLS